MVAVIIRVYTDRSLILQDARAKEEMAKLLSKHLELDPSFRPLSIVGREVARRRRTDQESGENGAHGEDEELFPNFGRAEREPCRDWVNRVNTHKWVNRRSRHDRLALCAEGLAVVCCSG